LNAADITGATNQSYTVLQTGFYNVIVYDDHGCFSSSATLFIEVTGISNAYSEFHFTAEPNPSNGTFSISIQSANAIGVASIELIDFLGRIVYSKPFTVGQNEFTTSISLPDLLEGNYWLRLKSENYSRVLKINIL